MGAELYLQSAFVSLEGESTSLKRGTVTDLSLPNEEATVDVEIRSQDKQSKMRFSNC